LIDASSVSATSLDKGIQQTIDWMMENKNRFLS